MWGGQQAPEKELPFILTSGQTLFGGSFTTEALAALDQLPIGFFDDVHFSTRRSDVMASLDNVSARER